MLLREPGGPEIPPPAWPAVEEPAPPVSAKGTEPAPPPPGPVPATGKRAGPIPLDDPRRKSHDKDAVRDRPPGPPPACGIGEDSSLLWTKEERGRVDGLREKLSEPLDRKVGWRNTALSRVLEDLSSWTGVRIEVAREDLADEPIRIPEDPGLSALDVLRKVCEERQLAFEVRPDKVVVKR